MRRTNRTLWIIAACVLIPCCGLIIGGSLYLYKLFGEALPFAGCMGGLDRIGNALEAYAKDHSGKLPTAEKWQTELQPYYVKAASREGFEELIKMKPEGPWGCWDQDDKLITGFAFNSDLSAKAIKDVKEPQQTPVIFEVPEIENNQHRPYRFREHTTSPKIVLGQRRGWLEMDVNGMTYMLIRGRTGPRRVPIGSSGNTDVTFDKDAGFEAKDPTVSESEPEPSKANEPAK